MEKPNLIESVIPCSGGYSFKKDMRLNAWLLVATLVYLATVWLLQHHPDWSPLTRSLVALTPMLPGFLYVRDCLRFVRGLDELQRRIQLDAWLFASLWTLVIGTIVNTLAANGVELGGLGHGLSLWGTFSLALVLWFVGLAIASRRYK